MSPSNFSRRPPATPPSGAEVYFVAKDCIVGTVEPEGWEDTEEAEVLRAKGDVRADDLRKRFDEAEAEEESGPDKEDGLILFVWRGGNDGGLTEVGRPPGLSDRVNEMPIPLSASTD